MIIRTIHKYWNVASMGQERMDITGYKYLYIITVTVTIGILIICNHNIKPIPINRLSMYKIYKQYLTEISTTTSITKCIQFKYIVFHVIYSIIYLHQGVRSYSRGHEGKWQIIVLENIHGSVPIFKSAHRRRFKGTKQFFPLGMISFNSCIQGVQLWFPNTLSFSVANI